MTSVNLEEKRLKQLKQQLFGKERPLQEVQTTKSQISTNLQFQTSKTHSQTAVINPVSFKSDLIKIITLSFLALLIQFSLFLAIHQGLLKLF